MQLISRTILFLIFVTGYSFAQQDSIDTAEDDLEDLLEETASENEETQVLDYVEYLSDNPININTAKVEDLLKIPYLDFPLAKSIIDYRNRAGHFFSLLELYLIPDIDKDKIKKALQFLSLENKSPSIKENFTNQLNLIHTDIRSRIITDIQDRKGFLEKNYSGNKFKLYNRIKMNYDNYSFGFLSEKDAGENSYTDFTAFHVSAKDLGLIKKIVLGDFNLEFGQGLALWSPYGFSKGGRVAFSALKSNRIIIPYLSSEENKFFRGAAASFEYGNMNLTSFYSNKMIDASLDSLTGDILSIPIDGYHRTSNEIRKKKTLKEIFLGGRVDYSISNNFSAGILYCRSEFNNDFPFTSASKPAGNKFDLLSLTYKLLVKKILISGEIAKSKSSIASLNSIQIGITKNITAIILIRNYPEDFITFHSYGFGENSGSTQNEFGIYSGLSANTKFGNLNIYFDQFKYPGPSYGCPFPAKGNEYYVDYSIKPIKKVQLNFRYKNEKKNTAAVISDKVEIADRFTGKIKAEIVYNYSKRIRWKSRFDYTSFSIPLEGIKEKGYLIYQDIKYSFKNNLTCYFRINFFNTDSYNSRVYEYENDVPGVLSSMALFGSGMRWYLMVKYKFYERISLSLKYSETIKPSEKTLSSGYNEIAGNLDNRINLQIDVNF